MMKLDQEAHVWLSTAPLDVSCGPDPTLSEIEVRRAARLKHPATRAQFLAGRALLRRALSHYAPVVPDAWEIVEDDLGKPRIVGPSPATPLRFNLSHADGAIAFVVTSPSDCGIDVESLDREVDPLRIAEHSFRPEETARLGGLESAARARHFFELWTLKEAYVKARGSGIRLRLDSAGFRLHENGQLEAKLTEEEESAWHFSLYEPTPRHRLAIALGPSPSARFDVSCWGLDDAGKPQARSLRRLATTERA